MSWQEIVALAGIVFASGAFVERLRTLSERVKMLEDRTQRLVSDSDHEALRSRVEEDGRALAATQQKIRESIHED